MKSRDPRLWTNNGQSSAKSHIPSRDSNAMMQKTTRQMCRSPHLPLALPATGVSPIE